MERKVEVGKAFGYGWEAIKKNFWYFVGLAFLYLLVSVAVNGLSTALSSNRTYAWDSIGQIIVGVFIVLMTAGYLKVGLSYYDGKKLPLSDLFTQFKYFWRVLGASLLLALIYILGFIVFIIPGIYLVLTYKFTLNLIVDKDLGVFEAMKESAKLTKGLKFPLLWLTIVEALVGLLGFIVFGVGILVAMPVIWLANIYVYKNLLSPSTEQLSPSAGKSTEQPA